MADLISKNLLVHKIVSGEANQELLDMLLSRQLPFTEEEYLESLVFITKDEKLKSRSMESLKKIPDSVKANYVEKSNANHRVAYYIILEALNKKNETVIVKAIHNQTLPYEFLLKIAEKGQPSMLEILLDNQIKLIAYPQIMDVMELNPAASNFIKGKIEELRDFYLRAEPAENIPLEEVLEGVQEILLEERKAQVSAEEREEEQGADEIPLEEVKARTLTMLQIINRMSVSERIRLALTGTHTQRAILIKDSNKIVSESVIQSPKITKDEIAMIIRNRSVAGDIIAKIAQHREWTKDYSIVLELVQNPKTPVRDALGFIKKLHIKDLKLLTQNKNANPVVRTMAKNFHAQKTAPPSRGRG